MVFVPGASNTVYVCKVDAEHYINDHYRYEGPVFGYVEGFASQRTAQGYRIAAEISLFKSEVEDPGWVPDREIRVGVLVHDADDPEGRNTKTIGVWRTAADAAENCASLTTFVTEK